MIVIPNVPSKADSANRRSMLLSYAFTYVVQYLAGRIQKLSIYRCHGSTVKESAALFKRGDCETVKPQGGDSVGVSHYVVEVPFAVALRPCLGRSHDETAVQVPGGMTEHWYCDHQSDEC